jgi:DNA-binding SARP family transcriptional activator
MSGNLAFALRIRLLGGFHAELGDRVIADGEWRLQKARGVVKLLALAPQHRLGREEVMERLWPDFEPEAARSNLYYALHVARAALDRDVPGKTAGSSALHLAAGVLTLAPAWSVCIDVDAFREAATVARQSKDPRAYSLALDLYAGELLPEDRYADWAARPRERLRDIQLGLLWDLGRVHQERGEYPEAIGALRRLVVEEPTHEEASARLMRLHAAAGQRQQALAEYAQLRTALREELDVEPGATTQHLCAEILAGRVAVEMEAVRVPNPVPTPLTSFIGRERELAGVRAHLGRSRWSR